MSVQHTSEGFSREQILKLAGQSQTGYSQRSQERSDSDHRPTSIARARSDSFNGAYRRSGHSHSDTAKSQPENLRPPKEEIVQSKPEEEPDGSDFEPYSSLYLAKRLIPHPALERIFDEKAVVTLPSLLAAVKSPNTHCPILSKRISLSLAS